MRQLSPKNETADQIKLIRKYLKFQILEDNVSFRNHSRERQYVYDLVKRTVSEGESHSAVMIGPRGSGKTTLLNSVLHELSQEKSEELVIIRLNGLVHHDEKVALKSIAAQMQISTEAIHESNSFATNLQYLLISLSNSQRHLLFILEEFHMFCRTGHLQTLLYSLFDHTEAVKSHCVIGITNRMDVMDLLEKRVKSRFSHRHIFIYPNEDTKCDSGSSPLKNYQELLVQLLSVPEKKKKGKKAKQELYMDESQCLPVSVLERCKIDTKSFANLDQSFAQEWNAHIKSLVQNEKVVNGLEKFCYYTVDEQIFRNVLFQTICKLSPKKPYIDPTDLTTVIDSTVAPEYKMKQLQSLSVLELSLVIAMMHGTDILDGQPVNFEMVLHRYTKFASTNSSTQSVPRPVILKAFEHLQSLEIILPIHKESTNDISKVQKEYKLYLLNVTHDEIKDAVKGYKNLPTEISQWSCNSIE